MGVVDDTAILTQVLLGWTMAASFVAVLMVHRTALLGFTVFAAFGIVTASHSALLWSSLFGLDYSWVSPEHLVVFNYVSIGMILFAAGVFVAWKPLRISAAYDPSGQKNPISGDRAPSWLTPQFVLLCMFVGAAGYILTPITSGIPTVHAIWTIFFDWLNVGILIAGFYSAVTGRYKVVTISILIFLPLGLLRTVSDGHAGALGSFLVQFGLVFLLARRVKVWQLALLGLLFLSLGPVASAWFRVRGFVRSGSIQGNPIQRMLTFAELFSMYYEPFNIDPHGLRDVLFLRIDFSRIYAAQVEHQPNVEPYAHGKTFFENILIILVPRILWPDKPVHFGGTAFVGRFTGMYQEDNEGLSVGTPVNLEFYANFGPWGAMLLLGVYGYCCARLELSLFDKNFRDLPKLMRRFVYTMVLCTTGSGLAMTVMKLIPGLVGVWLAGRVIENLRKSMRFNKDFLTPLDPKKKLVRTIVTGEAMVPATAGIDKVSVDAFRQAPDLRPTQTLPVRRTAPYGFRRWEGPGGK